MSVKDTGTPDVPFFGQTDMSCICATVIHSGSRYPRKVAMTGRKLRLQPLYALPDMFW